MTHSICEHKKDRNKQHLLYVIFTDIRPANMC